VMNVDGSRQRRLTTGKGSETHPAWSPSGDRIAFVRLLSGRWDIFVTTLDGARQQLTNDAPAQIDLSWSPQGDRIVFDQIDHGTSDLWTIPSKGGRATQITKTPGIAELNPAWSPVADEIAYDALDDKRVYDLYVLDLKTGGSRRVTNDAADDGDPAWSPDGQMLAYRHEVGGDYEIAKVSAKGGGRPTNVSNDPRGLDLSPSWQRTPGATRFAAEARTPAIGAQWIFACDAAFPGNGGSETQTGTAAVNHMCGDGGSDKISGCGAGDYESGGSATDTLRGFGLPGVCSVAADLSDWLKARDGIKDYVYGYAGSDHALLDAVDYISSVENPEY
jgi:hypothetical protein